MEFYTTRKYNPDGTTVWISNYYENATLGQSVGGVYSQIVDADQIYLSGSRVTTNKKRPWNEDDDGLIDGVRSWNLVCFSKYSGLVQWDRDVYADIGSPVQMSNKFSKQIQFDPSQYIVVMVIGNIAVYFATYDTDGTLISTKNFSYDPALYTPIGFTVDRDNTYAILGATYSTGVFQGMTVWAWPSPWSSDPTLFDYDTSADPQQPLFPSCIARYNSRNYIGGTGRIQTESLPLPEDISGPGNDQDDGPLPDCGRIQVEDDDSDDDYPDYHEGTIITHNVPQSGLRRSGPFDSAFATGNWSDFDLGATDFSRTLTQVDVDCAGNDQLSAQPLVKNTWVSLITEPRAYTYGGILPDDGTFGDRIQIDNYRGGWEYSGATLTSGHVMIYPPASRHIWVDYVRLPKNVGVLDPPVNSSFISIGATGDWLFVSAGDVCGHDQAFDMNFAPFEDTEGNIYTSKKAHPNIIGGEISYGLDGALVKYDVDGVLQWWTGCNILWSSLSGFNGPIYSAGPLTNGMPSIVCRNQVGAYQWAHQHLGSANPVATMIFADPVDDHVYVSGSRNFAGPCRPSDDVDFIPFDPCPNAVHSAIGYYGYLPSSIFMRGTCDYTAVISPVIETTTLTDDDVFRIPSGIWGSLRRVLVGGGGLGDHVVGSGPTRIGGGGGGSGYIDDVTVYVAGVGIVDTFVAGAGGDFAHSVNGSASTATGSGPLPAGSAAGGIAASLQFGGAGGNPGTDGTAFSPTGGNGGDSPIEPGTGGLGSDGGSGDGADGVRGGGGGGASKVDASPGLGGKGTATYIWTPLAWQYVDNSCDASICDDCLEVGTVFYVEFGHPEVLGEVLEVECQGCD